MPVDERRLREGIEGLIVLFCSVVFAAGVGTVTHSLGWGLIAWSVAFIGTRMVQNYGR